MTNTSLPPFKRDIWIIAGVSLLLSQVFISIGADQSWFGLLTSYNFLPDTLFVALLTALLWLYVRKVTGRLQKKHDWLEAPFRRLSLQVVLGLALPSTACVAATAVYFHLYYGVPISATSFPDYEFPFSVVIIGQFNLYYVLYYLYRKSKQQEAGNNHKTNPAKTLIGTIGRRNVPVEVSDIAHISIRDSVVYITTFAGSRLSVAYTLDDIQKLLSADFFRANRQVILHRKACKSFVNEANGKLVIEPEPGMDDAVVISQLKAPDFKKWISGH